MHNEKIARWAIYTYLIIHLVGGIAVMYANDVLEGLHLLRPEAFNVGYMGMDERAIKRQISDAFDQTIESVYFSSFFIWLGGFTLLIKYYRAQRGSLLSIMVLGIPILLYIANLMHGAIACHSLIENKISMIAPQYITDAGYRHLDGLVKVSSVSFLLSTAIMAIFYRRKG